jgi:hypothetical protein
MNNAVSQWFFLNQKLRTNNSSNEKVSVNVRLITDDFDIGDGDRRKEGNSS